MIDARNPTKGIRSNLSLFESTNKCNATVGLPTLIDFMVRLLLVWRQLQLEQDEVVGVACLVNFLDSLTGGREKISQNNA